MELNSVGDRSQNLLTMTDAELFAALRLGQKDALGKIYDRYSSLVYGLALRILTNPQEAEDLTHEIFLALWHRHTYDPSRGSASSFLATITRSRAIDKLRSRQTITKFLQRWGQLVKTETPPHSPVENASLEQRSQQVHEALLTLSTQQRQVLEMSYFQGLSQSEIAKQLNTPLGTIKSWCRQGLLKLRHNLQDINQDSTGSPL